MNVRGKKENARAQLRALIFNDLGRYECTGGYLDGAFRCEPTPPDARSPHAGPLSALAPRGPGRSPAASAGPRPVLQPRQPRRHGAREDGPLWGLWRTLRGRRSGRPGPWLRDGPGSRRDGFVGLGGVAPPAPAVGWGLTALMFGGEGLIHAALLVGEGYQGASLAGWVGYSGEASFPFACSLAGSS